MGKKQQYQVATFLISMSCTLSPPTEIASELQWSAHPNLGTSSTFFFFGLFEDAGSHPNYKMCCQADGLSTPGSIK